MRSGRRARKQGGIVLSRAGCRGEIVESADEHGADDAREALGGKQRRELCAGVFAEQHEPIGIDAELTGATANERERRTDIGERIFEAFQTAEPIVDREPVVARVSQEFENLSDMSDAAARRPCAAMNDDDGRTTARAWLNVGVERQVAGIADISPDARDDVVAVGIADVERRAGLRECRCVDRERDEEGAIFRATKVTVVPRESATTPLSAATS